MLKDKKVMNFVSYKLCKLCVFNVFQNVCVLNDFLLFTPFLLGPFKSVKVGLCYNKQISLVHWSSFYSTNMSTELTHPYPLKCNN
jgi:hypothetical protein